jgi:beta-lactam-binding protein with PASTA domain
MFRRRRQVTQETAALTLPPRRPLLWPWLVLLLAIVITGLAAAYLLTRDDAKSVTKTEVPSVVGLTAATAAEKLTQRGYALRVETKVSAGARLDTVLSQSPSAGTELEPGGQVTIVVARGPLTVAVPNVVGLPVDQAFMRLQAASLKARSIKVASAEPENRVIRQKPPGGTQARKGSTIVLTASKGPSFSKIPALRGLTEASATATLSRLGFRLSVSRIPSTQPKGIVVSQAPPPGTKAPKGSIVGINVSTGGNPAAGGVIVPKVVGLSQAVAVQRIEQAGLSVDSYPVKSKRPQGTVVSELPAGGTQVPPRSPVRINVSLGPGPREKRTVPDVVGRAEADARHALIGVGFAVQTVDQQTSDPGENGVVLNQKPVGGGRAPWACRS